MRAVLAAFAAASVTAAGPACHSNEGMQGRFPLWEPTWNMQDSTIIQPCNRSGFLNATLFSQYGVVSLDWSNAKQLWVQPPMSCEELIVEQAALLKAARPGIRVMGYRNIIKALPWFSTVREKMDSPEFSSWFLKFNPHNTTPYHVPPCDHNYSPPKCSPLYHDMEQTPNFPTGDGDCPGPCDCGVHPCGEYLFDYTNATSNGLADFIVDEVVLGGLSANLSGYYLDDEWYNTSMFGPHDCSGSPVGGPTEEDPFCLEDTGHAGDQAWTTMITDSWCAVRHRAFDAILRAGGWFWQMFSLFSTPPAATCAGVLRAQCAAGEGSTYYNATTMHALTGDHATLPNLAQDLATFLLLRGPYAFLGFGWSGCGVSYAFPPQLKLDYGEPSNLCSETAPGSGVFTREWTRATVNMDCGAYVGTITMK